MEILKSMHEISVYNYSFKKKDKAVTMKVRSTAELDGEVVHVDPQLLFQRLITTLGGTSDTDLETAFSYELCTFPTSIIDNDGLLREANKPFSTSIIDNDGLLREVNKATTCIIENDGLLREANKPQLADAIWKDIGGSMHRFQITDDGRYILDGGALLFNFFWRKVISYDDICTLYIIMLSYTMAEGQLLYLMVMSTVH